MNLDVPELAELIYAKTQKGRDELATRRRKLGQKLRSLLILIDGQKQVGDLIKLHQGTLDVPMLLRQLLERDYIKKVEPGASAGGNAAPTGTEDPMTAPASALPTGPEEPPRVDPGVELETARALAVRLLQEAMGRDAHSFAGRLERCISGDELLAAAQRYAIVIGTVRNKVLGDTYLQQVRAALRVT